VRIFLIILAIVVTLTASLLFAGWWWMDRSAALANAPTPVRIEPAARGTLVEVVNAPGQVQPKTKVAISARVAARVKELPYRESMTVKKGDLLVKLDSKDLEASLNSAQARYNAQKAEIEVAKARLAAAQAQIQATRVNLEEAQRDLRRQKELLASKDVSQSLVDAAQAKVDSLQSQYESAQKSLLADEKSLVVQAHQLEGAQAEVDRARENLAYSEIRSPIDGVVTRLNTEVGELVVTGTMNNPGTMLMEVADLSLMLVVARVDETSIAQVQVGQKARVRMEAYRDQTFEGTVDTVALAQTDERDGTRYYKTEILIRTEGRRIVSGLTADVEIETRRHENVIRVPSQAVVARPIDSLPSEMQSLPEVDKKKTAIPVVYRAIGGKAVITPVKIGASDMTHTVIESGLPEGEPVITGPYKVLESLRHDQLVKDERAAPTTQPTTKPVG